MITFRLIKKECSNGKIHLFRETFEEKAARVERTETRELVWAEPCDPQAGKFKSIQQAKGTEMERRFHDRAFRYVPTYLPTIQWYLGRSLGSYAGNDVGRTLGLS
jgi:hypothetical protein